MEGDATLSAQPGDERYGPPTRRHETVFFLLLAFVLLSVLSTILVGGFGFAIWMQHLKFGPPVY